MGGGGAAPIAPKNLPITWGSFQKGVRIFRGGRIPDEVAQIIEEIVVEIPAVAADTTKLSVKQQEIALRAELKLQGIAWRKLYAEALMELWRQKNEEEAILVILMSA